MSLPTSKKLKAKSMHDVFGEDEEDSRCTGSNDDRSVIRAADSDLSDDDIVMESVEESGGCVATKFSFGSTVIAAREERPEAREANMVVGEPGTESAPACELSTLPTSSNPAGVPDGEDPSRGVPPSDCNDGPEMVNNDAQNSETALPRFPETPWLLGDLEGSSDHSVFVKGPFVPGRGPLPPDDEKDRVIWTNDVVKMPQAPQSEYAFNDGSRIQLWDLVRKNLLQPFKEVHEFRDAILKYNGDFKWDFSTLTSYVSALSTTERVSFFDELLPSIINLALRLPELCTKSVPLLQSGKTYSITMSQQQCASLLANAFLSTMPGRDCPELETQFANYPSINFWSLFNESKNERRASCRMGKLRCILNYFKRVTREMPEGNITFTRLRMSAPDFVCCQARLQSVEIRSRGSIERDGRGMLMVDFANARVGGGVLRDGCVQEEIFFVLYPELICARLFTERLDDDEVLLVTGAERFNDYTGYSDGFEWKSDLVDSTPRDGWGRRYTQIVAMDATAYRGKHQERQQYTQKHVCRELSKAFVGFRTPGFPRTTVATGNWGCGAFGGNQHLKFLIQWMAASRATRPMLYLTFNDEKLKRELEELRAIVLREKLAICDVLMLISHYGDNYVGRDKKSIPPTLGEFFRKNYDSD